MFFFHPKTCLLVFKSGFMCHLNMFYIVNMSFNSNYSNKKAEFASFYTKSSIYIRAISNYFKFFLPNCIIHF